MFTFNPPTTKAIQSHDYSTSFLFSPCVSCHQFLWRHKATDWCRSQLHCLVIRSLDKTSEITVWKDAYSVAHFLQHFRTKRKVAGSFLEGGRSIFCWFNPSGVTMAVGSTELLTQINTRGISWGVKAAGAYILKPLPPSPPSCSDCLDVLGTWIFWSHKVLSRPVPGYIFLSERNMTKKKNIWGRISHRVRTCDR